jgi:K+-sensing histidine kinase KdpD
MKNIMVCVTQQKTCDRLIRHGSELQKGSKGDLYIIHVAPDYDKFLGNAKEGEALDYLYEKALEYGANLTVIRSNNILDTLVDLVKKNKIDHVVMGVTGNADDQDNLVAQFSRRIEKHTALTLVPPEEVMECGF